MRIASSLSLAVLGLVALAWTGNASADELEPVTRAAIDGTEAGWRALGPDDFINVNCDPETWTWNDGVLHCTGQPVGVIRSNRPYTNLELLVEWRHLKPAGNSGVFLWGVKESLDALQPGQLPQGIECQVLDNAYTRQFEERSGRKADWFTTHGDVFPTQSSKMTPFAPVSPNGSRSFPSQHLSRDAGQWNHYYIRAINGEVRLWVNGVEVSGGRDCQPATGYLCLESEGSPIEFRKLRMRELP